ncbi:glycoside hydrolase [Paraphaeosphaeria sporulosa]|uniref:Glycoside hydrolase n=1 Tax=Paraphaeosphaeria sporulosa TaxID=1460663 RepID=A0A177CH78_9PLEO|nr:glycoside hydrolase [Paraphaeosphaeria sporulosa]OAG06199.1 glycoside hydrolase [Paraphaeosphaeria sporulosa]
MVRLCSASVLLALVAVKATTAAPPKRQSKGTATIDLNTNIGSANALGAGFIYGFPDNGTEASNAIPDHFMTDIAFRASRAGGAQIPPKGWIGGLQAYVARFNSTLSNYRTTRKYGGDFILLPHDLWGSDGGAGVNALYPGDNGNWTETETFLTRLVQDLKAHDMLEGLVFDIWNEPDIDSFWARSWDQYLEYYVRATTIIRKLLPTTLISGPSAAHPPSLDDAKWKAWLSAVKKSKSLPDIYSWHQIGSWSREPDRVIPDFTTLLKNQDLPQKPIDINEYAALEEQNPANSAFYLAQLERHNLRGLRANWGSGKKLHDEMGNLVYKGASGYVPNGDWQLYKYYASMKGDRFATTVSKDLLFDVFATKQDRVVKIIAGTRTIKAAYDISIKGLTSLGLSADGNVNVQVYRFDWAGNQAKIGDPVNLGISSYKYSKDQLLLAVDPPTNSTAFAYEIRY